MIHACFIAGGLDSTSGNVLVAQLAFFLNLMFLFDFLVFMHSEKYLLKHREKLRDIYMAVAAIDAAISVGSYMILIGEHCNPVVNKDKQLRVDDITYPLPDDAFQMITKAMMTLR